MTTINLSSRAFISIADNGAHSVLKSTSTSGSLYCGFKPQIGDTESLERALRYVGATIKEKSVALKHFA